MKLSTLHNWQFLKIQPINNINGKPVGTLFLLYDTKKRRSSTLDVNHQTIEGMKDFPTQRKAEILGYWTEGLKNRL